VTAQMGGRNPNCRQYSKVATDDHHGVIYDDQKGTSDTADPSTAIQGAQS
jgi:hypothetical protein